MINVDLTAVVVLAIVFALYKIVMGCINGINQDEVLAADQDTPVQEGLVCRTVERKPAARASYGAPMKASMRKRRGMQPWSVRRVDCAGTQDEDFPF